MPNRFKIYPELHFGVARLAPGKKSFEELYAFAEEFRKQKDFPEVHYQLNDLRGCEFEFDLDKIKKMVALIDAYIKMDNQRLGVYIVDKPMETAYIQLFLESMNHNRSFCSTLEKAYELIALPVSFEEFEKLVRI